MQKCFRHYVYSEEYSPIQGAIFRQLLDICWPFTDYITFATREHIVDRLAMLSYAGKNPNCSLTFRDDYCALKEALHPWLAGYILTDEWFGYGIGSDKRYTYLYHATDGAKEAILSCYQDIFFRLPASPEIKGDDIGCFEDMCLFTDGKLFFGSISHEEDCFLWPVGNELFKPIRTIGRWQVGEFWKDSARIDIHKCPWKY